MDDERIFGTDGVRGRAGEGWLEPGRVSALGRAIGRVLGGGGPGGERALVAHDGRESGPTLESALARGLASAGFEVATVGLLTTPGLAILVHDGPWRVGAMISASHNPAEDNGIKVFDERGAKLSDELELEIERAWLSDLSPVMDGPLPVHDPGLVECYVEHLRRVAASDIDLSGFHLVLDCANGGASRVGPRLLWELGARVEAIAASPDGRNINAGCGSTHPETLRRRVVESGATVGIALDGDGDRCILVDERGRLVDGDGILTIVARDAVERGLWSDPRIVTTVMSNRGLFRALREVGVEVVTVGVGDRRVVEAMRREALSVGGEQSGHIVFADEGLYVGDGLATALHVLGVMARTGRKLSELAAPFRPFPQVLCNVPVREKPPFEQLPEVAALVDEVETALGEDGRVLLRYSGTEPLARVMVEGPDTLEIERFAARIAELLAERIGVGEGVE